MDYLKYFDEFDDEDFDNLKFHDAISVGSAIKGLILFLFFTSSFFVIGYHHGSWLWGFLIIIGYAITYLFTLKIDAENFLFREVITTLLIFSIPSYAITILLGAQWLMYIFIIFFIYKIIRKYIKIQKKINDLIDRQGWINLHLKLPSSPPLKILNKIQPLQTTENELIDTIIYSLFLQLTYQVDGEIFILDDFEYTWIAPENNPTKKLNYKTDLQNKDFILKCCPENPKEVHYFPPGFFRKRMKEYKSMQSSLLSNLFILIAIVLVAFLFFK
jgi:hypothetical protein